MAGSYTKNRKDRVEKRYLKINQVADREWEDQD
jgi:hypothetical protein